MPLFRLSRRARAARGLRRVLRSAVGALVAALAFFALSCESLSDGPAPIEAAPELAQYDQLPADRGLHADHYPASNERRIDLFRPYIENLGGGYLGVGTDQNFTFIAWAKSEYAYLMDFDYVAVDVNRIHMYFISISPTYEDFKKLWRRDARQSSNELLEARFGGDPADWKRIQLAFRVAHRGATDVPERLNELSYMERRFGLRTFSNDPADYQYIRTMIRERRILAIPGDLKGSVTMQGVARKARELDRPIRVVYTSNAEEYFRFPDAMRMNFLSLPVDEEGYLIRTTTTGAKYTLGYPEGEKFPEEFPFHYNIQKLENFKQWMSMGKGFRLLNMLKEARTIEKGFSIVEKTPVEAGWIEAPQPDAKESED